jgi:hypothetical protein
MKINFKEKLEMKKKLLPFKYNKSNGRKFIYNINNIIYITI